MHSSLCVDYRDAIRELCLPECASFGVFVTCEKCKRVWGKKDREWFYSKLAQAQQELETDIGINLCPKEICNERVWLDKCPTKLKHSPIAYLGKRVLLEERTMQICYAELSDCGADLPISSTSNCSEDNDLIGTVMFENIPEGVTLDEIEFCFPDFLCYHTNQSLPVPECVSTIDCDDEIFAVEAIWPRCELIHPNCDKAKLLSDDDCFLTEINVKFYFIDETQAIVVPGECSCGACDLDGTCSGYTIEVGDPLTGEVCIVANENACKCLRNNYVYVNYATAHNCGDPDLNLVTAITHLALIRRGKKRFCDCDGSTDYIEWLMEIDPSVSRENATPFEGENRFHYGKTRAGILVNRTVRQIRQRYINLGILRTNDGGFLGGMDREVQAFKFGRDW